MELFDLSGKTAIVTGGNQGIGFGIARGLGKAGVTVIIANRRVEEGRKAAASLTSEGFEAEAIQTDVSSRSSVTALADKVISDHGHIDILVNNAGLIVRKPVEETSDDDWDYVMDTNLKGTFICCQVVGQHMIERKRGKIINISSMIAQVTQPLRGIYAVSKAGISHLTRAFAAEWARYNVHVNAIGPGPTITPFNKKYLEEHPDDLQAMVSGIPLGRMGDPADYAGVAVLLASDASDFITGQTIVADGGLTLW